MDDEADPALQFFPDGEVDLYGALGLTKDASENDIKRAYRKLALKYHPDKQRASSAAASSSSAAAEDASARFQQIGFSYAVLSSASRRKRYDATGRTDESMFGDGDGEMDWNAYFKELWTGEVNADTLESFRKKYRESDEEKEDIIEAYKTTKGSLLDMVDHVPYLSLRQDKARTELIIEEAIKAGTLTRTKKWDKERKDGSLIEKAEKKEKKEEEEAKEMAREMGVYEELFEGKKKPAASTTKKGASKNKRKAGEEEEEEDFSALQMIMAKRNKERGSQLDGLVAKLEAEAAAKGGSKKKKSGSTTASKKEKDFYPEPTDEEFEKARARLDKKRAKK